MTDSDLFDALVRLLPGQFQAVLINANVPQQYFSSSNSPMAQRAQELVDWAKQSAGNRAAIVQALGRLSHERPSVSRKALWLKAGVLVFFLIAIALPWLVPALRARWAETELVATPPRDKTAIQAMVPHRAAAVPPLLAL